MAKKPTYKKLEQNVEGLEKGVLEHRRVEETLREGEEVYRFIMGAAPDSITIARMDDGRYLEVNEAFCRLSGYSREEAIGRTAFELNLFVDPSEQVRLIKTAKEKGGVADFDIQYRMRDGTIHDTVLSAKPLTYKGQDCLMAIVTVITEKKRADDALRQSEEQYRILVESMYDGLGIQDVNQIFTYANKRLCEMLGYGEHELLGHPVTDFLDEASQGILVRELEKRRRGEMNSYELTWTTRGGEKLHTIVSPNVIKDDAGQIRGFFAVVTDITERKRAEKALIESEKKYRFLVENAEDSVFIAQDGLIKFANPATLSLLGYSERRIEETGEIRVTRHVHPEERDAILDRHLRRLKGEDLPSSYSFRLVRKTGEVIWGDINVVLITWQGRAATLNFLRDKTHQKKLEEQLQQAQRMEAIGTLAGGIAHDFNNLLMGIQGNASLVLLDVDSRHPYYEKLKGIEKYVQNGAELTKQLLGFARGGRYEVKPTDLNDLIEESVRIFGRTRKDIKIHKKLQEDLWVAEIDQGQIEQVLLNLYVNAWQAMPGGGELFLQTENVVLEEESFKLFGAQPGKYVKISVTDTGVGMDEATQQKIFDPFFTTKEMGRGTGLGLASVYGIIKNHEGFLNVFSEKGEGTSFNIYLPASKAEVIEKKKASKEVVKGEGTILLVDDEEMIITVNKQLLESLGYKVMVARSGSEALEIYEKSQDHIDVVILDMVMPDMSGGDTYDKLREINPSIKVLLASGYSISGEAQAILDRGCDAFLQKPFNLRTLSRKVGAILDEK